MNKALVPVQTVYGWKVYYEGGGQLPAVLTGLYTNKEAANKAIELYQSQKPTKRTKNASSKNTDSKE